MYNKCIDCPFHKIIPDPDPTDWFNADDEAIVCKKVERKADPNSKYGVDRQSFRPIDVAIRPHQTKNVKAPDWCPISLSKQRDDKLENILKLNKI
jgi:hypothetical protein